MSQTQVDEVGLCDNSPHSNERNVQTQNLNETSTLVQNQSPSDSQNTEGRTRGFIQQTSFNNNGLEEKEEHPGKKYDEGEDIDEVMEEESEESASLIRCQSPDTPMTDSSFSETGSLLDTPYPFSPGTSPEPTSPVTTATSENMLSISTLETGRSDAEADSSVSSAGSGISLRASPYDSTTETANSTSPNPAPHGWSSSSAGHTEASDRITKTVPTQPITSSTELISRCEPAVSRGSSVPPALSAAETLAALTSLNTSTPGSATVEPRLSTAKPKSADQDLTFTNSPASPNQELSAFTPVPTCTGEPALLESLEDLVQRGDDARLPHYLHQIAEAFVLQEDYQRALCFIQLERLYHQRLLDNLSALQEQWESRCSKMTSHLTTHHLDSLKSICQTHNRPRTGDAECASVDFMKPEIEGGGTQLPLTFAGGMDQSKPAEQQGEDLHPGREKEETGGEEEEDDCDVEEAAEALELEDEGAEDEWAEKQEEAGFCLTALPVETLASGAEVEQLRQVALAQEKQHDDSQESAATTLHKEAQSPEETLMKMQEQLEEDEEEYELDQADLFREAPSLDYMAKLITVEEITPASGLVSILKKRVNTDTVDTPNRSEPEPKKGFAQRRVRFKVPDDSYDSELGGGDSCLLLFLLCLVTVVISVGGTALYCALGDTHSSVCQDFTSNADFYIRQIHRGVSQLQHWFAPGS
ncbi:Consortin [Oryzias melastigma]|uniref:Consortin n=1 Tax=Oryzias melastigma TaxID=30732 RepID=A0A834CMD2_ORYME|nr:Consortin [Oryzias melastigma]